VSAASSSATTTRLWRWRWRASAGVLVLAAAAYVGTPFVLGPTLDADLVARATFVQSVVASGHVEGPFRVNIGAPITGIVAEIPVAEGQTVKAGDVLLRLDDREMRAAVVQAEGAIAQAEARLRQIRELTLPSAEEGLREAQATLTNALQTYERAAKLSVDGFGTRAALDEATRVRDIAQAQQRNAMLLVFTNRPGGSDYVTAEAQLNQAHATLATAQARLANTVITAPRDGVLIRRDVERGNVVQPANVLMKLSPFGDTMLVVQIDEKNLGLIAIGQQARASADAFATESFAAELVFINPGIDLQRASVEVKLRVPSPPAYLRQDMTVSVDIEVARRPDTLILRADSVHEPTGPRPWVMRVEGGRAMRRQVTVGLVSAGKAEILDGLVAGDRVLSPAAPIEDGGRVRIRPAVAANP
jgi:HlyD family secretion protein